MISKIIQVLHRRINSVGYARRIGVKIGSGCRIGLVNWGTEPYLISIGNEVLLSSRVTFINHDGATWVFRNRDEYKGVTKFGTIIIGNRCFVGWGATLLPGSQMGDNSVLAAGSVLTKKVPAGEVWGGVPARRLMDVEQFAEKCKSGAGNVFIDGGNKRKLLESHFSGVGYDSEV